MLSTSSTCVGKSWHDQKSSWVFERDIQGSGLVKSFWALRERRWYYSTNMTKIVLKYESVTNILLKCESLNLRQCHHYGTMNGCECQSIGGSVLMYSKAHTAIVCYSTSQGSHSISYNLTVDLFWKKKLDLGRKCHFYRCADHLSVLVVLPSWRPEWNVRCVFSMCIVKMTEYTIMLNSQKLVKSLIDLL